MTNPGDASLQFGVTPTTTITRSVLKLSRLLPGAALVLAAVAACSSEIPGEPDGSPLAGLSKTAANDSSTGTDQPSGPGYVRGTVLGQSPPGAGNDSLKTAPRIAGVVIKMYARKTGTGDVVEPGDLKGTYTTGTDGLFTLPTVPSGQYVVTFVPPETSGYHGVWVHGEVHANSSNYPWWIVLQKKP
jgi:hypothetical protein